MIICGPCKIISGGIFMGVRCVKLATLLPMLMLCQCEKVQTLFKPELPKPTPYDFRMKLAFTPAAAAKMDAGRYSIVVTTFFYGHAKPEFMGKADDLHRIELGYKEGVFKNTARALAINSSAIDARLLPQTVEGEPYALVTITTGAPDESVSPDNQPPRLRFVPAKKGEQTPIQEAPPGPVIECPTYTGPIKLLQSKPYIVTCDIGTPD